MNRTAMPKGENTMIKAAHLYYDLLNLYGDSGNLKALTHHLKERGVNVTVDRFALGESFHPEDYDFVYLGSGTEHNLLLALDDMGGLQKEFADYKKNGGILLATGNSLELFGKEIHSGEKVYKALGLFDFTVSHGERIVRDVCVPCELTENKLLGFENHSGRISSSEPILVDDHFYLTYLIGPVLVRNPQLNEFFIQMLLTKQHETSTKAPDYTLEQKAYEVFTASL